ncbi:MAG: hypothetical protein MHM6MM_002212 [Cercozoa sp. M6MM]
MPGPGSTDRRRSANQSYDSKQAVSVATLTSSLAPITMEDPFDSQPDMPELHDDLNFDEALDAPLGDHDEDPFGDVPHGDYGSYDGSGSFDGTGEGASVLPAPADGDGLLLDDDAQFDDMQVHQQQTETFDVQETAPAEVVPTEPTPQSRWNEEHRAELAAKREEFRQNKKQARLQAQQDIADALAKREALIKRTHDDNLAAEQRQNRELESVMESGDLWQKVGKLVDLSSKASESRDVDRMRKLLLMLKQQGRV